MCSNSNGTHLIISVKMINFGEINILDMSSCKKVFKLRQNTPIWHFQQDQTGVTLRASEVKPKLDKYIIANCNGKIDATWYVNEGKTALDYKLRIYSECKCNETDKLPMFFANLGSSKKPESLAVSDKKALFREVIYLEIFSLHSELLRLIEEKLSEFFIVHNFGTRQSKGFGSFSVVKDSGGVDTPELDKEYVLENGLNLKFKSFFKVMPYDDKALFKEIEVFSKSIRSGINDCKMLCFKNVGGCRFREKKWDVWQCKKKGNERCDYKHNCSVFYMKSLLFKFLDKQGICWDKKLLKLAFNPNREEGDNSEILLWRDMLGLAERTKLFYGDVEKKGKVNEDESEATIKRFKSPVFIKPVCFADENGQEYYQVYVGCDTSINKYGVAGRKLEIRFTRGRDGERVERRKNAKMAQLDINGYLDYVINNGHEVIENTMSSKLHRFNEQEQTADYTKHEFYKMLKRIYSELKSNMIKKRQ